jgi:hypothetical protein
MGQDEQSYPKQNSSAKISQENSYSYGSGKKSSLVQPVRREEPTSSQRSSIRPKESMKDIMYGGGIGTDNENPQKVSFRVQFL